MESTLLLVAILLIIYTQIQHGRSVPYRNVCQSNEVSEVAHQLNQFENIPEIKYNSTQFAPMINALYKDAVNRRQHKIRYHSTKRPQCIANFFDQVDKMSKIIMTSGAYADRKEIILTQAVDETRRILSDVQPVYDAVRAYELLKNSSNSTAIEKCRLHDPHTILARFEHLVQQQPIALFERLAKGVHYDMMEFYSIALQLINRLSVCAVLTKVCDALRGEKTLEEQQHYQQIAANRLASIHDVLKEQVTALRSDFHEEQIRHDIQVALARPVKWSYGWKTMADTVREKISIKYYHHNWVVMAFESGKENSDVALEFADHRTFFFRLDEYSLVLHAAVADERCSEFAHIFSNGTKLTTLFNSDELFHNILAEEEDLARCASNLKELLLRYNLPADFFIGILQYRPNHAVSFEPNATSYHIEHLRSPQTGKLSKTVIISWC